MNEQISAFLVRLGADPALRRRFEQAAAEVMAEAGLSAAEQTEVLRRMGGETPRGRIFAASIDEPDPSEPDPDEPVSDVALEGRIHAAAEDEPSPMVTPQGAPGDTPAEMPADWSEKVYGDSADDVPSDPSGEATGATPADVSGEVYGDSADDAPRGRPDA